MEFTEFLVKAKINTYASNGEGGEKILADGCKELVYTEDIWSYRDRYFGSDPFIGEEIVSSSGLAVWGMNYYGRIIFSGMDAEKINHFLHFLKKALQLVTAERPFRGPADFRKGEWDYSDKSSGSVDKFDGIETICFCGKPVYELKYHGGIIKK
jgi:hypothetical protein